MSHVIRHGPPPDYCGTCYGQAKKHGRTVSLTTVYPYKICGLCEGRLRNGLVKYSPSNGTEYMMFEERCGDCRHYIDDGESAPTLDGKPVMCAHGVLDRVSYQMFTDHDHISRWFDPADIRTTDDQGGPMCPAECLRFTHKNDPDGERRDPPKPDCEGQMFFSDVLTVPEPEPVKVGAR